MKLTTAQIKALELISVSYDHFRTTRPKGWISTLRSLDSRKLIAWDNSTAQYVLTPAGKTQLAK